MRWFDAEQLKRAFLGGYAVSGITADGCSTLAQEDAKRPHRERETLVGEQTSIIDRMKGCWRGVASAPSMRRRRRSSWSTCVTPEGESIPPNTLAELYPEVGASGAGSWDVF